MNIKIKNKMLTLVILALAGCGGGGDVGGDKLDPSAGNVSLSGQAAKGILKNAKVSAYAVSNGVMSSQALQTVTTDSNGAYSFSLSKSTNPIVVQVEAVAGTTMLDESQVNADGSFKEISVKDLKLRSFVSDLQNEVVVQINALTDVAVQIAEGAKDKKTNNLVGLTPDAFAAGKQIAKGLAGGTDDPFTVKPVAKAADMKEFHVLMAGVASKANEDTNCKIQCQVNAIGSGANVTLTETGSAQLAPDRVIALQAKRTELVLIAQSKLKDTVASQVANITFTRTPDIKSEYLSSADLKDINGLDAFVKTMRDGFKAAKDQLTAAKTDLSTRYKDAALGSTEILNALSTQINDNCEIGTPFVCTGTLNSGFTWTPNVGGYKLTGLYKGSELTANVTGSASSVSITGLEVKNSITKQATFSSNSLKFALIGQDPKLTVNVSGAITAFDQQMLTSTAAPTQLVLALTNVVINIDRTNTAKESFSVVGGLSITGQEGDKLSGELQVEGYGVSSTRTETFNVGNQNYTNTYEDNESFVTKAILKLDAQVKNVNLLSLDLALSAMPESNPGAISTADNFEKNAVALTVKLTDKMSISANQTFNEWTKKTLTSTIKSGSSTINLSMLMVESANNVKIDNQWCEQENIWRCASSISLASNDNTYTATLKKSGSKVVGDIFKGSLKVGTIANSVLSIDGKEVSLY